MTISNYGLYSEKSPILHLISALKIMIIYNSNLYSEKLL